jgi:hypothetical protein
MLNAAQGIDTAPLIAKLTASGVTPRDIETLAKRHKLKPICSLILEQNALASSLEKPQYYVAHHLHMRHQLAQLASALEQEGVKVLLLKGAIQLYRPIYPRPGMRQLADLDVLIDHPKALTVFSDLRYMTVDPEDAFPTSLELDQGEHHLAPLWREKDAARIEPHVLPVPAEYAHIVAHVMSGASPAPGSPSLLLPSPADQFVITLIHAMRSDRTSVHGGLFMRSFVDLELLYRSLDEAQKGQVTEALSSKLGKQLLEEWSTIRNWLFQPKRSVRWKSLRSARIIAELQLRHLGAGGTIAAAITNLLVDLARPNYWRHGNPRKYLLKASDSAFWKRFGIAFRR